MPHQKSEVGESGVPVREEVQVPNPQMDRMRIKSAIDDIRLNRPGLARFLDALDQGVDQDLVEYWAACDLDV